MAKIDLENISSGYNATTNINNNTTAIENEFNNKVLYRDNPDGEANEMLNDLDMNSNRIINLPSASTSSEPVTYAQFLAAAGSLSIANVDITTEEITASTDGQSVFNLSVITYTPGAKHLNVYRNGVKLPGSSFTETSSTSITIVGANVPAIKAGDQFEFVVNQATVDIDGLLSGYATRHERHTATAGQTVFTLTNTFVQGINSVRVVVNGSTLGPADFTETSTNVITLDSGLIAGDLVDFYIGASLNTDAVLASNVSYTPAGSGAVVTDVQTKLREFVSVKDFGAVGDGVTDDTAAIQACFDSGAKNIKFPFGTYVVSDRIEVLSGTNITVDLEGSTISWTGTRSEGSEFDSQWGVFSFYGQTVSTEAKSLTSNVTDDFTFPLNTATAFAVGDVVHVESVAAAPTGNNYQDRIINVTGRIVQVSGNNVRLDVKSPYTIPSGSTFNITKLNPCDNITIKNGTISDDSGAATASTRMTLIAFDYASNCKVENINLQNVAKHGVHFRRSRYMTAERIQMYNPRETVTGGYAVQSVMSSYVVFKRIHAENERHVMDITAGYMVAIEDSGSALTAEGSYHTHGAYENNITIRNCYGYISIANGGSTFGGSAHTVRVINHQGSFLNTAQRNCQGVTNLFVDNCVFTTSSYINIDGCRVKDSEFKSTVYFSQSSTADTTNTNVFDNVRIQRLDEYALAGSAYNSNRDAGMNSSAGDVGTVVSNANITFNNCRIGSGNLVYVEHTGEFNLINTYFKTDTGILAKANVKIVGSEIESSSTNAAGSYFILNTPYAHIDGNRIKNIGFKYLYNGNSFIKITNNVASDWLSTNGAYFYYTDALNTTSTVQYITITGNQTSIFNSGDILYHGTHTNASFVYVISDNIFRGSGEINMSFDSVIKANVDNNMLYSITLTSFLPITAAPSTGTWYRGDRVYSTSPSASGNIGWVCVTAGSPGTWKSFGTIAS